MGQTRLPDPHLLVVAAFSSHSEALEWAKARLSAEFGTVAMTSPAFAFEQTAYYQPSMGPGLQKLFYVFENLVRPERLADIKRRTNELENDLADSGRFEEVRPLNLDPGLLSLGKFILATTKDQGHRVYLRDGIYAEVTLRYHQGNFVPWPHTYADYRQPQVLAFMRAARDFYRSRLRPQTSAHELRT